MKRRDILSVKTWHVGGCNWKAIDTHAMPSQDEVGECNSVNQKIHRLKSMTRGMKIRTTVHELVHALGLDEGAAAVAELLAGVLIDHKVL